LIKVDNEKLSTKKSIVTSICKMEVKHDNVIYVYTFEDAEIEIPEIKEMNEYFRSLGDDKPCYLMVFPGVGSTSSHEARKYAARIKGKNVMAEAIIIDNLAIRLLANFYMKINRPEQKIKLFKDEAAALEWINGLKGK